MMRSWRLLVVYMERKFLQWLAWRGFLLTLVINQTITPLLGLAVWSAALPGSATVSTYYVALLAVQLMTVSYEHHTFSNGIYDGVLTTDLLRPHSVVLPIVAENVALRIWHLLVGLPLLVAAAVVTGTSFSPWALLAALPALALAATLRFLFTYTLALSAFWSERAHGIVGLGETLIFLLGGAAAPTVLFPDQLRPLASVLPFRAMLGFPAEIAAGVLSPLQIWNGYGWQLLWAILFALLATTVWRTGIRHYAAVGG